MHFGYARLAEGQVMTVRVAGFGRQKFIASLDTFLGSEESSTLVKSKEVREIPGINIRVDGR